MSDLAYETAVNLAKRIRAKEFSSLEVTEYFLNRIDSINHKTNSFVTVTHDLAIDTAKKLDLLAASGQFKGPLHGVPIAIKDLGDARAGVRSTFGSAPMSKFIADTTTSYVQSLEDSGGVIVGKTNSPEFGHKGITDNYVTGATSTPFDLTRNSGGSSGGGAAAVAAGMVPLAQGSDGGGSVRIPAAWCGIFAIKPSFGRIAEISRPNAFALSSPFVGIGPMARTVRDSSLMLSVMAGTNQRDPFSLPDELQSFAEVSNLDLKKVRIAYSPNMGGFAVEDEIAQTVEKTVKELEGFGAIVEIVELNFPCSIFELSLLWKRLMALLYRDAFVSFKNMGYDLLGEHAKTLTPVFREMLDAVDNQSALETRTDQYLRTQVYDQIANIFDKFDFLISPTLSLSPVKNLPNGGTSIPKFINGIEIEPSIGWCLTFPINFTGNPAVSIPCGLTKSGLPIGMQIVGKRHADRALLGISATLEKCFPWDSTYANLK